MPDDRQPDPGESSVTRGLRQAHFVVTAKLDGDPQTVDKVVGDASANAPETITALADYVVILIRMIAKAEGNEPSDVLLKIGTALARHDGRSAD
jgi:hypothetical protein